MWFISSNPPPTCDESAVTTTPRHEAITLTAVHPIDPNKPPDYNDALEYRKNFGDGYPEPSLVDQPPSYDTVID